jgi:hypothetical protein
MNKTMKELLDSGSCYVQLKYTSSFGIGGQEEQQLGNLRPGRKRSNA